MACTSAVIRDGLHRSLTSSFHVLRVATARSPRARMGRGLVHGFLPDWQLWPVAVAFERRAHGAAGALVCLVRGQVVCHRGDASAISAGGGECGSGRRGGSVMGGQRDRGGVRQQLGSREGYPLGRLLVLPGASLAS